MNKKNFKIKPKVWPKEYTFEEFKQLNPTINENLLINHYNKYLQEYAETRSRHIDHFNDTKDTLTKELNLLNEKLINNSQEWSDGDMNVGPSAGSRLFKKPLEGNLHSIQYDHTNDVSVYIADSGTLAEQEQELRGAQGTIKPTEAMTVSVWINGYDGGLMTADSAYTATQDSVVSTRDYNVGYEVKVDYRSLYFQISTDDGDGTHTLHNVTTAANVHHQYDKIYHRPEHPGWIHFVGTFDGRYLKCYSQGHLAEGNSTSATGHSAHTKDLGSSGNTMVYTNDSKLDSYGSSSYYRGIGVGAGIRMKTSYGGGASSPQEGELWSIFGTNTEFSGSIGEIAIWDVALDADTIMDIYSGSRGPYEKKYDLNYSGYNNGENNNNHPYDLADEGISYKNVGRYAENLQAWWRMNEGSGTTVYDHSGNNRNLTITNGATWDGMLGTSASAAPGT